MAARKGDRAPSSETKKRLIAGTQRCIIARGFGSTTARDIAAETGANLAAVNYHFGSKDALLTIAMLDAIGAWTSQIDQAVEVTDSEAPLERLERFLRGIHRTLTEHREMMVASVQAFAQAEYSEEIRGALVEVYEGARANLPKLIFGDSGRLSPEQMRGIGSAVMAMINGFVLQWLLDPDTAPEPAEFAAGIAALAPHPPAAERGTEPTAQA